MKNKIRKVATVIGGGALMGSVVVAAVAQGCADRETVPDLRTTAAITSAIRPSFATGNSGTPATSGLINYNGTQSSVSGNSILFLTAMSAGLGIDVGSIESFNNFSLNSLIIESNTTFSVSLNNFSGTTNNGFIWEQNNDALVTISGEFSVTIGENGTIVVIISPNISFGNLRLVNQRNDADLYTVFTALETLTSSNVDVNLNNSLESILAVTGIDRTSYRFAATTTSFADRNLISIDENSNNYTVQFLVNFSGQVTLQSDPTRPVYFGQAEILTSSVRGSISIVVNNGAVSSYVWTNVVNNTTIMETTVVNPLSSLASYNANTSIPTDTATLTLLRGLSFSLSNGGTPINLQNNNTTTPSLSSALAIRQSLGGAVITQLNYVAYSVFNSTLNLNTIQIEFDRTVIFFGQGTITGNSTTTPNNRYGFEHNIFASETSQTITTISNVAMTSLAIAPSWNGFETNALISTILSGVTTLSGGRNLYPTTPSTPLVSLLGLLNRELPDNTATPLFFINNVRAFNINPDNIRLQLIQANTGVFENSTYRLILGADAIASSTIQNQVILTAINAQGTNPTSRTYESFVSSNPQTTPSGIIISGITFTDGIIDWLSGTTVTGLVISS